MRVLIGNGLLVACMLIFWNCVGPEDPIDGLLEDLPAVVNTVDAFTFNLKGNNYSFEIYFKIRLIQKSIRFSKGLEIQLK